MEKLKPGNQPKSEYAFDDLHDEYMAFLGRRKRNPTLWVKFLLQREDDGNAIFGRAVDEARSQNKAVQELIEKGRNREAIKLMKLCAALERRYDEMFKPVQVGVGIRHERIIAPVLK